MTINLNEITPNTTFAGANICNRGHIIVWAGDLYYGMPDGMPCACGMTEAKSVTCPTCGHTEMKMVKRKEEKMREICLEGELYIHEEDHLEVVRKLEKENDGLVKEMKIKDSAARDALAEKDDPLKISEELNKKGFTVVPLDQWLMVNEQIAALKDELADELADYIMLERDYEDASRLLVEAREQIAALTTGRDRPNDEDYKWAVQVMKEQTELTG